MAAAVAPKHHSSASGATARAGWPAHRRASAEGDGFNFTAPTRFDKLFSGAAVQVPAWMADYLAAHPVTEQPLDRSETLDADYGRLLERACNRKGSSSPPGFGEADAP